MSTPTLGSTVQYQIWDGEEGRSYGWFLTTKTAKIVAIEYVMDNGDRVKAEKVILVPQSPTNQTQISMSRLPETTG